MGSKEARRREYAAYLQSPHWKQTRARIMDRAHNRCEAEGCERAAIHVHHRTYARLGHEDDSDLMALCFSCHAKEHPDKHISKRKRRGSVGCAACNRTFKSEWGLAAHAAAKHGGQPPHITKGVTADQRLRHQIREMEAARIAKGIPARA